MTRHDRTGHIIVVSGVSGSGKTTLCARLAEAGRAQGLTVRGILSLPRLKDRIKVGIDVLDLDSGGRQPLAEARGTADGPATGVWHFHAAALAWGSAVVQQAVPCDLLLIDELGPLELERGEGWAQALTTLRQGSFAWAVVVVRPELVQSFLEQVAGRPVRVVQATLAGQDALRAEIAALWGRDNAED